MKIAMIIHGYYPKIGGAERFLQAISPPLKAKGADIHILTRHVKGLPSFECIDGIAVRRLPGSGSGPISALAFTLTALFHLFQLKPDIVHAHIMFSPAIVGVMAKKILGIPLVITVHRSGPPPYGEIARLKQKFLGKMRLAFFRYYTDKFIVISEEIDQELSAETVPEQKRQFIPNSVDTLKFSPVSIAEKKRLRKELNLPDGPVAVFTGRLNKEKRVRNLVEAWDDVCRKCKNAFLIIVGDGPLYNELLRTAGRNVRFTGGVDDVKPYLNAADLFILPSVSEGLSISLLEAMATGLPVIVSNIAGAKDLVEHKKNGWVIPPDDVNALKKAIVTLLLEPGLQEELGKTARHRVKNGYSLHVSVKKMYSLYKNLIEKR